LGAVATHPGPDGRMPSAPAALGRVDVDAADNAASARIEHGVGEATAPGEVVRMPFQITEILLQGHLARPAPAGESGRRPDVADAGRGGGIIRLGVLRTERLQPESVSDEPVRYREILRDEQLTAHRAILIDGGRPVAAIISHTSCNAADHSR